MLMLLYRKCENIWKNEDGAVIAEYAMLLIFIGLTGFLILKIFPPAIRGYLKRIYFLVSSPLP